MSAKPLLSVRSFDAWYGPAQALFAADFDVAAGEVVALVGPNGAGKSTTLKALVGLLRTAGSITLADRSIHELPTYARAQLGVGWVPEDRRIFTDLSVGDNLRVPRLRSSGPWDLARLLDLFPNLAQAIDRKADAISGGEQQMLAIARTLIANPTLMLVDEPSEGLAPRVVELMARAVGEMKRAGLAVLLSEQNAHFARAVADRELRIESGRIQAQNAHRPA